MSHQLSRRRAAALLLVLAIIVLVIGMSAERSCAGEATAAGPSESTAAVRSEGAGEAGEAAEEHRDEGAEAGRPAEEPTAPHDETAEASETMLGINPESTSAIAAAVVISVVLAAALWVKGTPGILGVAALFALLFATLDLREVMHQLQESRGSLAVIALLAALLHGGAAAMSGLAFTQHSSSAV